MKWITRSRPHVDRVACPWLIRRFVDPEAKFLFVESTYDDPEALLAVAEREGATPFDVAGVEFSHHASECSFDAFVRRYDLTDPALLRMAAIVRGADTNSFALAPESAGLEAIAAGFRLVYVDDHEQLAVAFPMYDALYAWCGGQVAGAEG